MVLAKHIWRREVCGSDGWTTHRNGATECPWRLVRWKWLGSHYGCCKCYHRRESDALQSGPLFCLQHQAFTAFKEGLEADNLEGKPFDEWCADMETSHPQFLYWSKTQKLEILFLQFMQAKRDGNFLMYLEALGSIVPWMFAMDHFHYARWLSVHVRDLIQQRECPKVWNEFLKGHFVTQKTSRKFSMMAHDQIHEQLNAIVKGWWSDSSHRK